MQNLSDLKKQSQYMRRIILAVSAAFVALFAASGQDNALKVMSYNMLFEHNKPEQQERRWHSRVKYAVRTINELVPDVIGSQELQSYQVNDILEGTGYERIGCTLKGNYSLSNDEENAAIFYRKARLRLLASGNFWYNDHPDTPGPGLGMTYNRMCTWGKFEDLRTHKVFFIFNSHFFYEPDKQGVRMECARILRERVLKVSDDYPVVVTGDLNSTIDTPQLQYLISGGTLFDSRSLVDAPKGPEGTYYDFNTVEVPTQRLDHVLVNDKIKVLSYEVVDKQWRTGEIESDHLPVLTYLEF